MPQYVRTLIRAPTGKPRFVRAPSRAAGQAEHVRGALQGGGVHEAGAGASLVQSRR